MRVVATNRARRLLVGVGCVYLGAVLLGSFPLALLGTSAALAYSLLRWSFVHQARLLRVAAKRRVLEPVLYSDQVVTVEALLEGTNPGQLGLEARDAPPPTWSVVDNAPQLAADAWGDMPRARYSLKPSGRGSFRFGRMHVVARDAHKLFEAHEDLPAPLEVRVNASLESVRRGRAYAKKKSFEPRKRDPIGLIFRDFEFEGIREYQAGDRLRDIDWKTSTRFDEIMAKVFEREMEGIVYCLVDASRTMRQKTPGTRVAKLDHAADLVLQVGEIAGSRNFQLGLIVFDERGILVDVPASRSRGQERILAQRILHLPDSLEVRRTLDTGAASDAAFEPSEHGFLNQLRILAPTAGRTGAGSDVARVGQAGASAAAARLMAVHPNGSLFVFAFTDFATLPEETTNAAVRLLDRNHKVAVGMLPADHYLRAPAEPTLRDVENAYREEKARRRAAATLRGRRAHIVELNPDLTVSHMVEDRS